MIETKLFKFEDSPIRVVYISESPWLWFLASDICKALKMLPKSESISMVLNADIKVVDIEGKYDGKNTSIKQKTVISWNGLGDLCNHNGGSVLSSRLIMWAQAEVFIPWHRASEKQEVLPVVQEGERVPLVVDIPGNELLPISMGNIGKDEVKTVNARDIWVFVGSKRKFGDWIKQRIAKYGFVEGQDYTFHKIMKRVNGHHGGGSTAVGEYHVSIDMGKELAMLENNEKGKQVRRYFIESEKKARLAVPSYEIGDPEARAIAWAAEYRQKKALVAHNEVLTEKIEEDEHKVEFFEDLIATKDWFNWGKAVKSIEIVGPNQLYFILRQRSLLNQDNTPSAMSVKKGYFKSLPGKYEQKHTNGTTEEKGYFRTAVSMKGLAYIKKLLKKIEADIPAYKEAYKAEMKSGKRSHLKYK